MPEADTPLSDFERELLEFERQRWKYVGAKETAVRERFEISMTRYYQVLDALMDRPAAMEADPQLVNRLRRVREMRGRQRGARPIV